MASEVFGGFEYGFEVSVAEVVEGVDVEDVVVGVSREVKSVVVVDGEGGVRF